jgi:hypothetical protein
MNGSRCFIVVRRQSFIHGPSITLTMYVLDIRSRTGRSLSCQANRSSSHRMAFHHPPKSSRIQWQNVIILGFIQYRLHVPRPHLDLKSLVRLNMERIIRYQPNSSDLFQNLPYVTSVILTQKYKQ